MILARPYLTSQLTGLCPKFSEICRCPGIWTLCSSSRTAEVFGQTTLKRQQLYQLVRPRQTPWWFCFGTDEILPEWESMFPAFLGVKQSLALRLSNTTAHTVCLSLQAAWNRSSESCSASSFPPELEISYTGMQQNMVVLHCLKGVGCDAVRTPNNSANKYLKH